MATVVTSKCGCGTDTVTDIKAELTKLVSGCPICGDRVIITSTFPEDKKKTA